jgi:hypothetical protein
MGRLIDADAFERSVMCSDAEDMQDVIYALRDYPTAYDPDKVVEQLEKEKNPIYREVESIMGDRQSIKIDKAIEIVKGGGIDG